VSQLQRNRNCSLIGVVRILTSHGLKSMPGSIVMDARERRRRAAEEAAAWWVWLRSEKLARSERERFVDWLRESPMHVAEILLMAEVHDALVEFRRWPTLSCDPSPLAALGTPSTLGPVTKR
jgi:Domain of unknown function (DUF4880)